MDPKRIYRTATDAVTQRLNNLPRRLRLLVGRGRRALGVGADDREVASYSAMREDNAGAPATYHAGAMWGAINRDFADLIWSGALKDLRNQYFSRRFAAWDPRERIAYYCLLRLYRASIRERDTEGFLDAESDPTEGGCEDQETIAGRRVSLDFLQSVEEALSIREAWRLAGHQGDPRLIIELGAGYGRLAYVARRMFPDSTYVICDLPEALACSSSWLARVLPGEVVPYEESRHLAVLSRETLLSRPCWTLGAHQLETIEARAADAFVNIYSFAEMPVATIEHYFAQIDRVTRGIFFTKQRKREENAEDGAIVTPETYPIRRTWKPLFERTTTLYDAFFEAAWGMGGDA